MIFLASPYTHADPVIVDKRVVATEAFVVHHLRHGVPIFSPIVYCERLSKEWELPTDASYWQAFNHAMIQSAEALWVLCLPGWEFSRGVQQEIALAKELGTPVFEKHI